MNVSCALGSHCLAVARPGGSVRPGFLLLVVLLIAAAGYGVTRLRPPAAQRPGSGLDLASRTAGAFSGGRRGAIRRPAVAPDPPGAVTSATRAGQARPGAGARAARTRRRGAEPVAPRAARATASPGRPADGRSRPTA